MALSCPKIRNERSRRSGGHRGFVKKCTSRLRRRLWRQRGEDAPPRVTKYGS